MKCMALSGRERMGRALRQVRARRGLLRRGRFYGMEGAKDWRAVGGEPQGMAGSALSCGLETYGLPSLGEDRQGKAHMPDLVVESDYMPTHVIVRVRREDESVEERVFEEGKTQQMIDEQLTSLSAMKEAAKRQGFKLG